MDTMASAFMRIPVPPASYIMPRKPKKCPWVEFEKPDLIRMATWRGWLDFDVTSPITRARFEFLVAKFFTPSPLFLRLMARRAKEAERPPCTTQS